MAEGFNTRWNFPNCLGALDGKHVRIKAPPYSGATFFNYKGFNSIVLMAVVDADTKFLYADVGCNGRISDGGVFKACDLDEMLSAGQANIPPPACLPNAATNKPVSYHLVADDAFPLREDIMKPFSYKSMEISERVFNYRLSRARRVVENAFGILSNRFRIFLTTMCMQPEKCKQVVLACCALHNYLRAHKDQVYNPPGYEDREDAQHNIIEGSWRKERREEDDLGQLHVMHNGHYADNPKTKRDLLKGYFMHEGSVPWQMDKLD